MGDEISRRYFDAEDFSAFRQKLDEETNLLRGLFEHLLVHLHMHLHQSGQPGGMGNYSCPFVPR